MTSPETLELEAVDAALAGRYVAPEHAELAELALLLRDDKPQPAPAWATHLDRRVEAGFPAAPRRRSVWLRKAAPALAIAACLVPVVVGAALIDTENLGGEDEGGGSAGSTAQELQPLHEPAGDSALQPGAGRAGGNPGSDGRATREQERSATLTLAVPRREIDQAANEIGDVTADVGGFVARSRVSSSSGGLIRLRVPSSRLDETIQRLSQIGRVRELSRSAVDITATVVSARERLADARAERKALLTQLADAVTVNETESIRARLDIVSREIAVARDRLRRTNNRANFADVSVTLAARGAAEEDEEGAWTPADAFDDALRVLEVAAGIALIAAAVLLPLGLVWLLVWLARRGVTRRQRERALDMA
jgi:Domain of unknown function (DUF4349)